MKTNVAVLAVVTLLALHACGAAALFFPLARSPYARQGPCRFTRLTRRVELPPESNCTRCNIPLTIHVPTPSTNSKCTPNFTTIFEFNAFSIDSSYYRTYPRRLASWGYAVVQYDIGIRIQTDANEIGYLPYFLTFLEEAKTNDTRATLFQTLDLQTLATLGHSRGGKLAALHLALTPNVQTGFLIDPVDNTQFAPEGPDYPSAVRALDGLNKSAGIMGADKEFICNPEGANYNQFYEVVAPGSWLETIRRSGHMSFTDRKVTTPIFNLVCGKSGLILNEEAVYYTAATAVAWFEQFFRDVDLTQFFTNFIGPLERARKITFDIKA